MDSINSSSWLSAHLYYAEPWEPFLLEAILPLTDQLLEEQLVSHYFFIRYWEKGPHIRLRLKVNGKQMDQLKTRVSGYFSDYFEKYPSERTLTEEMIKVESTIQWHQNNSIVFENYIQEINRYGGPLAFSFATLQFFASTQVVLEHLQNVQPWTYDHALGVAIKLHLTFVKAIGMSREKAVLFFEMIFQNWLSRALPSDESELDVIKEKGHILNQFEKSYAVQEEAFLPYITGIWEKPAPSVTSDLSTMYHWWHTNQLVAENLQNFLDNELLEARSASSRYEIIPGMNEKQTNHWSILADYLHMTNNRLGVMNRDEPFLAYLLTTVLKVLI